MMPVMMAPMYPLSTTMLPLVMQPLPPMVPRMVNGVPNGKVSLGASLRDRATLPSPLRGLGPSGGYPSRLRSLRSLRAPLAAAVRCAHRRCRTDTLLPRFIGVLPVTAVSSSRRRCAPRSSSCSPRSPWPAAPAAGLASARRGGTSCLAGVGFAVHRLAHRAMHHPARRCLRSCARSCRTRPHFAPHRAAQSRPHQCGPLRLRLRQRAAHDCLRLRPHRPPLIRRGGSTPPASPASIPPSLFPGFVALSTPFGGSGSHPTHLRCRGCRDWPSLLLAGYAALVGARVDAWRAGLTCHRSVLASDPRLPHPVAEAVHPGNSMRLDATPRTTTDHSPQGQPAVHRRGRTSKCCCPPRAA